MKYEIRTNVINGNLKRNRNLILNALETFEGSEIVITIQKAKNVVATRKIASITV